MRLTMLSLTLAAAGVLTAGSAFAESLRQPASVYPTTFEYDFFQDEVPVPNAEPVESPSDRLVTPAPAYTPGCDPGCAQAAAKGSGGWWNCNGLLRGGLLSGCACAGEPWTLLPENPCRTWNAGGWAQVGYHTEGTNGNGDGLFNNYPNVVQLHQGWLWLERPMDLETNIYDWGFRVDYVYGTDGPDTQAFGGRPNDWDNDWDNGNYYGHAIPQLYMELGFDDLKIKAGKFFTILGYEVVPSPQNFFYSRAFTMVNAEPFTHTGVLAEYAWSENVTFYGGWAAGWDTGFTSYGGGSIFLGGFSLQLTERMNLAYMTTMGDFGYGPGNSDSNGYAHSIVLDWNVTDRLNYVLQTDYVDNDRFLGTSDKVWGVNQYLIYRINDCLGAGIRFEHFEDPRIGDQVNSFTMGLNIRPHRNVVIRPEVRFDDYGPAAPPRDTTIFGIDAIMTF